MNQIEPIQVFVSYSRRDASLLRKLQEHLANLEGWQKIIKVWWDRKIGAGQEWANEIDEHLDSSKIILLLISPSFMKSQYCYDVEVKQAMARHASQEACVVPVILRPCDWADTPFSKLQTLPLNGEAVTSWDDQDKAFLDIALGVRRIVEGIKKDGKVKPLAPAAAQEDRTSPEIRLLPYLCNRDPQLSELEVALTEQKAAIEAQRLAGGRPLVCVIHGKEEQCPEWFEERLKAKSFPAYFKLNRQKKSMQSFSLPLKVDNANRADLHEIMRKDLATSLAGKGVVKNSQATKEEMLRRLAALRRPVLIYSRVNAGVWRKAGRLLSLNFMQFWNSWPALPSGLPLVAILLVKYQDLEKVTFYQRCKFRLNNALARRFLTKKLRPGNYEGMNSVVLSELESISKEHVENWIYEGSNFDRFCRLHQLEFCNPPEAIARINSIFKDSPSRRIEKNSPVIPMNPLAEELKTLLKETRCPGERT